MTFQKRDSRIIHRALIIPDSHAPLVDRAAFDCVLQAIMLVRPDRVVHLGDIGEFEHANHHIFEKVGRPTPVEIARGIRSDVRAIRKTFLDPLDRICKEAGVKIKNLTIGNHDYWLNLFVDKNPDYAETSFDEATGYNFEQVIDWKNRGWALHPIGQLLRIGQLAFYHGHLYNGLHHPRTHLLQLGISVMYGHFHSVKYDSITHANGLKGAWCLGCIKRLDPQSNKWLGGRLTSWGHAFAIVDWYGTKGHYTVHVCNVIGGKASLISDFVDGNEYKYV